MQGEEWAVRKIFLASDRGFRTASCKMRGGSDTWGEVWPFSCYVTPCAKMTYVLARVHQGRVAPHPPTCPKTGFSRPCSVENG